MDHSWLTIYFLNNFLKKISNTACNMLLGDSILHKDLNARQHRPTA